MNPETWEAFYRIRRVIASCFWVNWIPTFSGRSQAEPAPVKVQVSPRIAATDSKKRWYIFQGLEVPSYKDYRQEQTPTSKIQHQAPRGLRRVTIRAGYSGRSFRRNLRKKKKGQSQIRDQPSWKLGFAVVRSVCLPRDAHPQLGFSLYRSA